MSEETKLLPCPFCGSDARISTEHDEDAFGLFYYVICQKCRSRSSSKFVSNGEECPNFYEEVRELWNARHQTTNEIQTREEKKEQRSVQFEVVREIEDFYDHCHKTKVFNFEECEEVADKIISIVYSRYDEVNNGNK